MSINAVRIEHDPFIKIGSSSQMTNKSLKEKLECYLEYNDIVLYSIS